MSFANHNILDIALSIIPPTVVQIRKNLGTKVNKYGQSESAYSEWIEVYGIVQPGSAQNERTVRVDFSKKHVSIWLRGIALDGTHIQSAPDQIRFLGRIYNVTSVDDWFPYDNYRKCECVEALNLGPNQRALNRNQDMEAAKRRLEGRRRVVPKNPDGPSYDNLKLHSEPCQPIQATDMETIKPMVEKDGSEKTDTDVPKKDNSLVGKARIRF